MNYVCTIHSRQTGCITIILKGVNLASFISAGHVMHGYQISNTRNEMCRVNHSTHSIPQDSHVQCTIGCFGSVSSMSTVSTLFEEHLGHTLITSFDVCFSFSC
ncbi:MAG: hypothetical protein [Circular genetic element sp.]|nr:MAG: hypothetical protein [Circular genetic element sp.]